MKKVTITTREVLNLALDEELERDKTVFIIGEEVTRGGAYKVTENLNSKYKKRIFDTPICEYGFTGMSIGSAFAGLKPVVDFMTFNFSLQAIDHILNSSAKSLYMSGGFIKNSIVFRGPNGFAYGVGAQHTHDVSILYASTPGLKVVAPYTAKDHKGCLKQAIRDPNPVVFLENEILYNHEFPITNEILDKEYLQEFKAVVEKKGNDLTIIGVSISVSICLEVSEMFEKEGISVEVINLVSIRPLDFETIKRSAEKTKKVAVIDFNWKTFGVGSEISAFLSETLFGIMKSPVLRINALDVPTPYNEKLEKKMYPSKIQAYNLIKKLL